MHHYIFVYWTVVWGGEADREQVLCFIRVNKIQYTLLVSLASNEHTHVWVLVLYV